MIKKLESATRYPTARRGFQHVGEVIERLIRLYELQAEMKAEREATQSDADAFEEYSDFGCDSDGSVFAFTTRRDVPVVQSTFGWE